MVDYFVAIPVASPDFVERAAGVTLSSTAAPPGVHRVLDTSQDLAPMSDVVMLDGRKVLATVTMPLPRLRRGIRLPTGPYADDVHSVNSASFPSLVLVRRSTDP